MIKTNKKFYNFTIYQIFGWLNQGMETGEILARVREMRYEHIYVNRRSNARIEDIIYET